MEATIKTAMVSKETSDILNKISDVRVRNLMEEEAQLEISNEEVRKIKGETIGLIAMMEEARDSGFEIARRVHRNEIVVLNLRLVTQVLKKYGYFSQDKFQNGCIGLLKAAETFNSAREVPFGNYACFCIEIEIRAAFRRVNRAFEGKKQGFLDSLDSPVSLEDGEADKYNLAADPFAEQDLDAFIDEAEVDTLFYEIIIPCIEQYGTRSKDIDMELWKKLELQYFIEMSMEGSQRQRLTLSEMARQLGTVTQNLRMRHKKVMELIRAELPKFGYYLEASSNGRRRVVHNVEQEVKAVRSYVKHTDKGDGSYEVKLKMRDKGRSGNYKGDK